jgi:hypothetical protein
MSELPSDRLSARGRAVAAGLVKSGRIRARCRAHVESITVEIDGRLVSEPMLRLAGVTGVYYWLSESGRLFRGPADDAQELSAAFVECIARLGEKRRGLEIRPRTPQSCIAHL